jgi:co-chaperonin GroES (HSP10)
VLIKPLNRHLVVTPHFEEVKDTPGVLLPEDFKKEKARYILATVLSVADDCTPALQNSNQIIILSGMLDKLEFEKEEFYLILENHVLGLVEEEESL